jgi:hypothetical protein
LAGKVKQREGGSNLPDKNIDESLKVRELEYKKRLTEYQKGLTEFEAKAKEFEARRSDHFSAFEKWQKPGAQVPSPADVKKMEPFWAEADRLRVE